MVFRDAADSSGNINAAQRGRKTVEQTYTKLTQLEHVLVRPDTYVGSVERMQQTTWVWDQEVNRMVYKEISYPPGLYKIFDEILVNAADHAQRDAAMDCIKVEVDPENQSISVWNNGSGIPVEMHKKEKIYVPELIFGHLLTSSNYDDNEKKVVGGRNGFGAKLANIFSTEFIVETADAVNEKRFKQVFRDNMNDKDDPIIRSNPRKEAYTKITFSPDLKRFGMTHFDDDIVSLMKKRVYDIAGVNSSIKVYLNGSKINIKSFKDYVALYPSEANGPIAHERLDDRWEVAITASDGQLSQVSFVNSIWTIKGGTHVTHVADNIVTKISDHIQKKDKGVVVKPFQIKSHLSLFINCLVENPSFDSQTKETLTTKPVKFGSKWSFSDELAKKVMKSDIIENVLAFARFKQEKELSKTDGGKKARITGITKLEDANKAGGREASKCTLILTEGDSAKALAISGLSVVGRDYYGVFPLRGKLLNVREAKHKQIMDNTEINHLKKILGLQHGKTYNEDTVKSLRYGHVLIMADQDYDGSHIKGLVINFFDTFWPSLLQVRGFIQEFITPIVKCIKGNNKRVFFTVPQYKEWADTDEAKQRGWVPKYYKGLGTSTAAEAKGYFSDLPTHLHKFTHHGAEDSDMIEMAFSKQRVNDRKEWLSGYVPGTYFDHEHDELNYSNFVNKELILFSVADNSRSIPNVIDGFKPSQRKVMYACFKRKLTKSEIKVVQLAGYVSEHAAYHHGDMSLQATIVGLAQNFVGSNNVNLLVPAGQFGTRLLGGKDAASSRYIFTKLAPIARAILPEVDDPLLDYLEDDGDSIEPKWYCPVIPLVLVNGSDGIGTGWSSFVPCYNPRDLIRNIRHLLAGEAMEEMTPWYRGFNGSVVPVENAKSFDVYGSLRRGREENTFKIDELPIRSWTTPYKEFLESSVIGNSEAKQPFVKEFQDNGTENKVDFTFTTTAEHAGPLSTSAAYKRLKLSTTLSTNNMVLFDSEGRIRKYETPEEIIEEFFKTRLVLYDQRRTYLLRELERELLCLDNKQRFITMVIDGKLKVAKRKKADLVRELTQLKFDKIIKEKKKKSASEAAAEEEAEDGIENNEMKDDGPSEKESGYDYLLSMPLWSLTLERVRQLGLQRDKKEEQKQEMEATTGKLLWEEDLRNLEIALEHDDEIARKQAADLDRVARLARSKQRRGGGGKRKGGKVVTYEDMDDGADLEIVDIPTVRTVVAKVPRVRKPKAEGVTKGKAAVAGKKGASGKKKSGESEAMDVEKLCVGDDEDDEDGGEYSEYSEGEEDDFPLDGDSDGDEIAPVRPVRRIGRARQVKASSTLASTMADDDDIEMEEDEEQPDDSGEEKISDDEDKEKRKGRGKGKGKGKGKGVSKGKAGTGRDTKAKKDVFDISDDDIEPVKAAPRANARGRKKTSVRQAPSKIAPATVEDDLMKTPPPPPKRGGAVNLVSSEDEEDEEVLTLSARLNKRLHVSKKSARSSLSSTGSSSVAAALEEAHLEAKVEAAPARVAAGGRRKAGRSATAVKRGAVAKKAGAKTGATSVQVELSPGKSPAAKKTRVTSPVHAAPKGRRGRLAKKVALESESEEVDEKVEEDVEEKVENTVTASAAGRRRPARAATRKVVIEESDEGESDEDSVEFVEDDDDDSDFE